MNRTLLRDLGNITFALALIGLMFFTVSGCAGFGVPSMSPEQLVAAAKDKNASVACATGTGAGGKGGVVYVNVDKSSINKGSVTVTENCTVTISAGDGK